MKTEPQKNWYVPHPLFQYREDVKALAREGNARIVDANVVPESQRVNEVEGAPKLTLRKVKGRVAATTESDKAAVAELAAAGLTKPREYSEEELAKLAAAGVTDPTSKSAEEIAAILAAVS